MRLRPCERFATPSWTKPRAQAQPTGDRPTFTPPWSDWPVGLLRQPTVALWVAPPAGRLMAAAPAAIVERAVSPLVDNALRYAHSRVTVITRSDEAGTRIEVTDDGPGVPASFAPELFHPGRRAEADDGHSGAGLGLPLARRLARSADGDVHHDASHRDGTRLVVTLPAA
ncbi:sensor histidine kinase [Streptomyces sp. NPDC051578]|uniref:sensor histidine kinase n=1 Tax=Streptomyces sp. NPDC051578 TaxID=3365662 RepID=UPI0037A57CA1